MVPTCLLILLHWHLLHAATACETEARDVSAAPSRGGVCYCLPLCPAWMMRDDHECWDFVQAFQVQLSYLVIPLKSRHAKNSVSGEEEEEGLVEFGEWC
jgi:hypothetical protein